MENRVSEIVTYILSHNDFQFANINESYGLTIGEKITLDISNSHNLTYNNMGATIIDGILQAGVNYDSVVRPRVDKFREEYGDLKTTNDFYDLITKNDLSVLINFKGAKIQRIHQLTKLLKIQGIETEKDLFMWLSNDDNVLTLSNIKGIKDKTINYLKILTGHKDTLAIDVRLRNFIKLCCKDIELFSDKYAFELLKKVALKLKVEPTTLDYSIWKYMSK